MGSVFPFLSFSFSLLTCLLPKFSSPIQACGHLAGHAASLKAKIMLAFIVYSVYIRTPLMFPLSINSGLALEPYLCFGSELGEGVSGKNAFMVSLL